jgi:hypothetical protein
MLQYFTAKEPAEKSNRKNFCLLLPNNLWVKKNGAVSRSYLV